MPLIHHDNNFRVYIIKHYGHTRYRVQYVKNKFCKSAHFYTLEDSLKWIDIFKIELLSIDNA
jgi:hypothetical protein